MNRSPLISCLVIQSNSASGTKSVVPAPKTVPSSVWFTCATFAAETLYFSAIDSGVSSAVFVVYTIPAIEGMRIY